jgi:flavin reductase (DIM6/NTAB) family NADH-FMN oxidoreductase RutF
MSEITMENISTDFKAVMRRFPAAVNVIVSHKDGVDHGMTATAVMSVSMDPPSLVVCINNNTFLHEILLNQPTFSVNVLTANQQYISNAFSGQVLPEERFKIGQWERHSSGVLALEDALAKVICKRMAAVPYGTHTLFIGKVIEAGLSEEQSSLLYENTQYCTTQPQDHHK